MRLRCLLLPLLAVLLILVGCSHELESPSVGANTGVGAIEPDVVCVEQLTTAVTLHGEGFTPMPQKTLEDKQLMVLPKVVLSRATTLDGAASTGSFTIVDEPTRPGESRLHWVSEQQMWFDVYPEMMLDPGVYAVEVTNPDERHKASFNAGLVAVPRPKVTEAHPHPDLVCTAQGDNTMEIVGEGFLQLGSRLPTVTVGDKSFTASAASDCVAVPGTYKDGTIQQCKKLTFVIPKTALAPGEYSVFVTNPEPAGCNSSQDAVKLRIVPPPSLHFVEPDLVCDAQADQVMTLKGTDFLQIGNALPTVTVGDQVLQTTAAEQCTEIPGNFEEGKVLSCQTLRFTIPMGKLPEGDYAVTVTNPKPADCHSIEHVSLHVAPPPTISALDKQAICDEQSDQTIVITGTKFLKVGDKLPSVTIGTWTQDAKSASGCTALPGTYTEGVVEECTSLTVVIPKGTFTAGEYDVKVTNPPPAGCSSTESLKLKIEDPPQVDAVVPSTVCQGGSVFTVQGSGFIGPVTVELQAQGQSPVQATTAVVNAEGTEIVVTIGLGAQVGITYDVVVTNGDGCTDDPPHKTVTVVPGPMVFFIDPEVVYNGVNTRATVYATSLTLPLPAQAIYITPTGATDPKTYLDWAAVPQKPNRLQVIIPKGQIPGVYDLHLNDSTSCEAFLPQALRVTDTLSISLRSIVPPFGWTGSETAVTIFRDTAAAAPMDKPFVATPRAFLNPTNPQPADIAIPLESVAMETGDKLTAVVPRNQPAHLYDLIVVNPDGTVGLLANAFTVQQLAPPTVDSITPASIVNATGQSVKITGKNFHNSTAAVTCDGTTTAPAVAAAPVCDPNQNCTQQVTIDASTLASGAVCVVRITNDDGSYADYSAVGVTGSSFNLPNPKPGTEMNVGRRALVAASGNATEAARFVYAIGGDDGAATPVAFDSVEAAPVDLYGAMGAWQMQRYTLGAPRNFAASARMGRYIYVYGGSNGTDALATAQRAMILNPREVPQLDVDDLALHPTVGLAPGYWMYKVSAVFAASDLDNPGGESLPSDEFIVKVPAVLNNQVQVVLRWSAPVDSLGQPLPNIAGYRIYRTAAVNGASGTEVLIREISDPTQLLWTDDGTATVGTDTPLPLGSTGKWATLATMGTARKGAAGMAAVDPADPTKFHVYAFSGLNAAGAVQTSYEFLTITVQPNGHQTAAASWTAGTSAMIAGRWQFGAWLVDSTVTDLAPAGTTWIYLGGGMLANSSLIGKVEAAQVQADGQLGAFNDTPKDFGANSAGYGVCAANGRLYSFGGQGAAPASNAKAAAISAPLPSLANNSWNDEGLAMTHGRYLLGSAVQSAFIFLVGGQTDEPSAASKSTELVIW